MSTSDMGHNQVLLDQEIELKHKLYEHKGIQDYRGAWYVYENKFDINLLKTLRIALLTTEMVEQLTFDHLWNHETFDEPLSRTHEHVVLNALYDFLNLCYKTVSGKDYKEMRRDLSTIDNLHKLHLKNIFTIQDEEQQILKKNLEYVDNKITELGKV